jgi:hypothetical protein
MRSPHAHWALLGGALVISFAAAQTNDGTPGAAPESSLRAAPAETTAAAVADPHWQIPRTSWGQPSLEGVWSTDDLRSVPMNRPARFGTRAALDEQEFRERAARDEAGRTGPGDFLQHEWGIRTFGYTSLVIDPPNGQVPPLTPAGDALAATRNRGTFGPGPFDSLEDFTLYDRCITRGVLGSLLPVIYGNGLRITQSPEAVAITYEMIHDTRIIPVDGRAALDAGMRQWMGSARGRWDGDTLVVESAGFTDRTNIGVNGNGTPNSEALALTERFTRVDPDMIEYTATINDPVALTAPFTIRLMITKRPGYEMLEYSCHEGNGAVRNALSGERVYEKQVADALAKGLPAPARATEHEQIRNGVPDPSAVIDINAGE